MLKLLDCTLRDGGYINNWEFGKEAIRDIANKLEKSKVDILELGFLKNEPYNDKRTVFNQISQMNSLISDQQSGIEYAAMIEAVNPIPLETLEEYTNSGVDIIRVIIWKTKHDENGREVDALQEGYEYCRGIIEKGYKLCVQPARVEQYTDIEFVNMLKMFQQLNPMAIYVVDSWGTQDAEGIMHYVYLADSVLDKKIAIGYHGHNSLMQVVGNAISFIHANVKRNLIVDASVYGIGRCAGNLNLEVIATYLNERKGKKYCIEPILDIYEKYIAEIYQKHPWGYSIPYYLTAQYHCNPNYGEYYGLVKLLKETQIKNILSQLSEVDKILFTQEKAEQYYIRNYENTDQGGK